MESRATLAQMCQLRVPKGIDWELLVVDNNCTDDTPAVVERYAGRLPIRRLVEKAQGTSHAKNRALGHATGELLLWTDDDVLVDEEWMAAYLSAAGRWPSAGFFGGLITPWFEREPPGWFAENSQALSSVMVLRDLGPIERPIGLDEPPFGANMAFRRSAFSTLSFDVRLGPHGNDQIRGEETLYCRTLAARGVQGVWVPSSKVQHYVVADRLTLDFVRRYCIGMGREEVRRDADGGNVPRWIYRRLLESYARYFWQRTIRHPDWLKSLMEAARVEGVWMEYRSRQQHSVAVHSE